MKKGTLKDTAVVFGSVIKNPASFSFDYIVSSPSFAAAAS